MRVFVALSLLEEKEWSMGTGSCCADPLELFLRKCLRGETNVANNLFAGHVSLYFEDADASMVSKNKPFAQQDAVGATSFSVDILEDGRHSINLVKPGACGWYGRWSYGIVQLYQVLNVNNEQIRRIHSEAIELLNSRYTSMANVVALLPWLPWACCTSYCCCCCCNFTNATNCTGAVQKALRSGLQRPLGIPTRFVDGGRLPSELVQQLEQVGIVRYQTDVMLVNTDSDRERECVAGTMLPLLAMG